MILANISVPRWNNICRFKIWPYFRGELRDSEKMYNPMTISELKRYLFTSKWGFATDRNKLDSVGNNPPPLHLFLSEVVNWINVWVCCAFGNVSLCQMTAMISSLNPDLPWLKYINSLLADYDVQVKTKTALNVVCLLSFLQLLKSFRSYLVVFKLVVLLEWCFNQEWSC